MASIRPFQSIRPAKELASAIPALPYDVYSSKEARDIVKQNSLSFLQIDRAETQFAPDTDMYSQPVYEKARDTLNEMIENGYFVKDKSPCYYIYALTQNGHTQTGLVGCASIDDYLEGRIKKHEHTREDKELDRIRHIDTISAQTGPIFLAYHMNASLNQILNAVKDTAPLYDFTSKDHVRHQVWQIKSIESINKITYIFEEIDNIYIADGHHRAASAVKTGLKRRTEHPDYDGSEEFNYFLSVLFPAEELHIYDYNRVVSDLNGYTFDKFLDMIRSGFEITDMGNEVCRPSCKGEIGLYGNGRWYLLKANPFLFSDDPVDSLDVSVLQNVILGPLLGIRHPKTDTRIQFMGGVRGLKALSEAVDSAGKGVAFAMYPTSMEELLRVADAGRLMPPKSTWFEPKLRSGLFIHQFER
ncbi:DUF1015 domain-containing protein [Muricomes intestini]|jgi:uncharacterized protein (DUF1015 family)|uniref:Uncharacterized protein (DUF1015 family) n=1 Tax=Muricomes intestini TaxID=1796634 RepID=A0A4V2URE1_9FIRM|nr:DUF1015 family protein [Muricomes intestini]TCS77332.1 uncharacterized protein (DUF1015 family) [Muricomes intestini]HAX51017.1 DUF1015 domain-containing protein [Lachnospiraceae bacterium]HCR82799.1 DUF1015 domain-containing protein [Lachnospiraceae bacterium]